MDRTTRWITKEMEVAYTARATSGITCLGRDRRGLSGPAATPTCPVCVRSVRDDGTVVIEGTIRLWVTEKR